jgi:cephalosporin-C deacetylase-like acetyl esterase
MNSAIKKSILLVIVSLSIFFHLFAQPAEQPVKLLIAPNHQTWQCKVGDLSNFKIIVMINGVAIKNAKIFYQIGPERMKPFISDSIRTSDTGFMTPSYTMKEPGFLRCIVTTTWQNKQYKNLVTIGYDIEKIIPTVTKPNDFDAFWQKAKEDLSKIPTDARLTLLQDKSTSLTNVYHVSMQNYGSSKLYGILCVPKKSGKYPAILQVPGAGIRPYFPDLEMADKGFIVFTIGIHGIPVNMDQAVYNDLNNGALKGYFFFNASNRDNFYYKRVYMGCIRANDFITSLPEFDGKNLAVSGNSQGGALSIITAAIDDRVKYLASVHPALSDMTGYFHGRAGGWPHIFAPNNLWGSNDTFVKETMPYYDVVNFAKKVKIPGYYTWGFNDETCPPTSMYAAYNVIQAQKETALYLDSGHWMYPEQKQAFNNWLIKMLNK